MSITKRIDQAREAFAKRDLAASEKAHSPQYIGDMVYGGLAAGVAYFMGYLLRGLGA